MEMFDLALRCMKQVYGDYHPEISVSIVNQAHYLMSLGQLNSLADARIARRLLMDLKQALLVTHGKHHELFHEFKHVFQVLDNNKQE